MLNERKVEFRYREYRQETLDVAELQNLFKKLSMTPNQLLRARDAKNFGLSGDESEEELIVLMAKHPTLLQRPILMDDQKAALGRPIENLLSLL